MSKELRSEILKVATLRSTYVIAIISLLIVGLASYVSPSFEGLSSDTIAAGILGVGSITGQFAMIFAILLIAHEYRYNTITYTLTATNNRFKTLLSKAIVVVGYAIFLTLAAQILSVLVVYVSAAIKDVSLGTQIINIGHVLRSVYYAGAYALFGLALATISRSLPFSIFAVFFLPNTVEGLLSLLLKDNSRYLPFMSLQAVVTEGFRYSEDSPVITPLMGVTIFTIFLAVVWLVTAVLFRKRDAS